MDYLTGDIFDIYRCDACGLQLTHPLPVGPAIGKYYPERYRGNRHGFTGVFRCDDAAACNRILFCTKLSRPHLDIGCGDGSFAMHMKSRGWDVAATEIDPHTVDRLRDAGIDARLSSVADETGFEKPFDAITCWHVLEHMEHPREVTGWVRTQLAPAGYFQATVPNVASLQARAFGRKWIHLDVPRHRQHFTPRTLEALLDSAGFTVRRRANFAMEYDWFGVIQSALNVVCATPNVLFERLIHSAPEVRSASLADKVLTVVLSPAIATVSLPVIGALAFAGDGATLTLTCQKTSAATGSTS